MKKDTTTITRYFILLVIIFVVWLFLIHNVSKEPAFRTLLGLENSSWSIIFDLKK